MARRFLTGKTAARETWEFVAKLRQQTEQETANNEVGQAAAYIAGWTIVGVVIGLIYKPV